MDYKLIKCPKCGKMHFKEVGFSIEGSYWDFERGFGVSDCLDRSKPIRIYKDGQLENPEAFVPTPKKEYFKCLECGCHFSVKTTYLYVGGDIGTHESHEVIDEDKVKEEREKFEKEHEWEYGTAYSPSNVSGTLTLSNENSYTRLGGCSISLPESKATIDMGGFVVNINHTFTEEQIKNIETYFGWKAENK